MIQQIIKNNIDLLDLVKKNNIDFDKNITNKMIELVINKETANTKLLKDGIDITNKLIMLLFKNGISLNSNLIEKIDTTIKFMEA